MVPLNVMKALGCAAQVLNIIQPMGVWVRTGLNANNYNTSSKGGPDWRRARARITVDARHGNDLDVEGVDGMFREKGVSMHRWLQEIRQSDLATP